MGREDEENKKQNFWVDSFKRNVSGKIRDLQKSLQSRLRALTLEDLAQIAQSIGTKLDHLDHKFGMSVAAIATELLRRINEKPSTVEARAEAGSIVRVEEILPTMSKEEVEAKLKDLKNFIDESDAPNETKSLTFSMLEPRSSKVVSEFEELRSEVQNFVQKLKQIKGK